MSIRSMMIMSAVAIATLTTPPSFAAIGRSASAADGAVNGQLPCGKMANASSFADALVKGDQRSQLAAVRPAANSGAPIAR